MTHQTWDGQTSVGNQLAVVIPDQGRPDGQDWPRPPWIAVAGPGHSYLLEPIQIGDFLKKHEDASIACFDVDSMFWTLEGYLRSENAWDGRKALLNIATACRIHDIQIFHQLSLLALDGSTIASIKLCELAGLYEQEIAAGWQHASDGYPSKSRKPRSPDAEGIETHAAEEAGLVLRIYHAQVKLADTIAAHLDIAEEIAKAFGRLSVGLQSQGAIALARMSRAGVRLQAGAESKLRQCCEKAYRECSRRLYLNDKARKAFKWVNNLVARDGSGFPEQKSNRLREWIVKELDSTSGTLDIPPDPPRTNDDQVSIVPEFWGDMVHCRPLLQDWAGLWSSTSIMRFLQGLKLREESILRPSYVMFPRLMSRSPGMEDLRALHGVPISESEDGHLLLVGSFEDLLLHSQAVLTGQTGRDSHLGGTFLGQVNPRYFAARRLYAVDRLFEMNMPRSDEHLEELGAEFDQFPEENITRKKWGTIAGGLLEVMLRGLDHVSARSKISRKDGIELTVNRVEVYWNNIIDMFPDLWVWLYDDQTLRLANRHFDEKILPNLLIGTTDEAKSVFLRKLLSGKTVNSRVLTDLARICGTGSVTKLLKCGVGSDELYREVFQEPAVTGTGRLRRGVYFSEARAAQHVELAEDAIKTVLYGLVAANYDLVAWAGSEFVVQIREDQDVESEVRGIRKVAEEAVRRVLHQFPPPCKVAPVLAW